MAHYDFAAPRLHVAADLRADVPVPLDRTQSNYLATVLRLKPGGTVLAFNGRDGEWRTTLSAGPSRREVALVPIDLVRAQTPLPDLLLLFAPLKHARLDYLVQKAVEMGAGAIRPVFTRRTVPGRINRERMDANVIEAAEQCGILAVPAVLPELDLPSALAALEPDRLLVHCDEDAPLADPIAGLRAAEAPAGIALLVGPEGGFAPEERALVAGRAGGGSGRLCTISLGPRILRADTAAVAALALVGATLGDWR